MKFLFVSLLLSLAAFNTEAKTLTWAGQFPKQQAEPIVQLFNEHFSKNYGFKVNYISENAAIESILSGTPDPLVDLVHLKDVDTLNEIRKKGLTSSIQVNPVYSIPSHLVDKDNHWVGLLKRLRIIYYNSDLVSESDIANYEDLAKPQFKNQLCLRQAKAQYTVGFHAFLLGVWGSEKTSQIMKGWAENSEAIPLLEKDLDHVIANVENGTCSVGIANTYYFARHLRNVSSTKVKYVFPNVNDIGAHINVDGVALLSQSKNRQEANEFVNWLLSVEAQTLLSEITDKFPVNPTVENSTLKRIFPHSVENTTFDLNGITNLKEEAYRLSKEAGLK